MTTVDNEDRWARRWHFERPGMETWPDDPDYWVEWRVTLAPDVPFERCRRCGGRGAIPQYAKAWDHLIYRTRSMLRHCTVCDGRGLVDKEPEPE